MIKHNNSLGRPNNVYTVKPKRFVDLINIFEVQLTSKTENEQQLMYILKLLTVIIFFEKNPRSSLKKLEKRSKKWIKVNTT